MAEKRIILIIMDGWGIRADTDFNAVAQAKTPAFDRLRKQYPSTILTASGLDVGLPEGQMGNSEVGHLNLGAGRIVYQEYTRINKAVADGSFVSSDRLTTLCEEVKKEGGALHVMGLLSDGGVHSHIDHVLAAFRAAHEHGIERVFFHAFLDGRDTPPTSGAGYMQQLVDFLSELGVGRVASLQGRYFGMDRDKRWERVEKGYDAIVLGRGRTASDPVAAIRQAYDDGQTDEFVTPTVIVNEGKPVGEITDGDGIFFINFRADRAREITRAIAFSDFDGFVRQRVPRLSGFLTMTRYDETFPFPVVFGPQVLVNILGEVFAELKRPQLRIAETEKYAHVTFFFSGGQERLFALEDRVLIASPKDVPTYDLKPEMSAFALTERVTSLIGEKKYGLIVLNFANADMVGHTGVMEAAVKAVQTVDECVGRVVTAAQIAGYTTLITADHGNAEEMWDYTNNEPHTAHTTNPVPFILVDADFQGHGLEHGILADVAPTILAILGQDKPAQMTGRSLIR
ncbi:MAG: 2,3-bisphosphoglycerate-independent phosphoglycerate mutase [Deltaproteobacteria bacterium]|nr:2,3-bisphosphoglycerate-independent phosphoglycerate mutase [Candidatus Zymogenaceae bacterium]